MSPAPYAASFRMTAAVFYGLSIYDAEGRATAHRRRFRVPGQITLARFHLVLLAVMAGRAGLCEFRIGQCRIGKPEPKRSLMADLFGDRTEDASRIELRHVARQDGARLAYVYDFGDDWRHQIVVEKMACPEADADRVVCLDGRRACPPEDCGGVWAYNDLLAAMAEPATPSRPSGWSG